MRIFNLEKTDIQPQKEIARDFLTIHHYSLIPAARAAFLLLLSKS
jgi:hypothetical protein